MAPATSDRGFWPQIALRKRQGESVRAGGAELTPESLVLTIRLPFGGFVWQRPLAVIVTRGASTTRLPIRDATRRAQGLLLGGAAIIGLIMLRRTTITKEGAS